MRQNHPTIEFCTPDSKQMTSDVHQFLQVMAPGACRSRSRLLSMANANPQAAGRTAAPVGAGPTPVRVYAHRKVVTSVTITPEQLNGKPRLEPPAQLALVREGIFFLRTPAGLQSWAESGKMARAIYSCEMGQLMRAHFQAWDEGLTTKMPVALSPGVIEAARKMPPGQKKLDTEQKNRNAAEKPYVEELRK